MENLLILLGKYFLLITFLYLFGRTFVLLSSQFMGKNISDNYEVSGINIQILYPIFGLFFLGNLLFIINFFIPLKNNLIYGFFLLLLVNFRKKISFVNLKNFFISYSPSIILLVSSFNINFHYDAGLYHLNNQKWILESNLVKGLSNIYAAFGVGSIHEYLSAILWIDNSYILLHLMNLVYFSFFYGVIFYALFVNKVSYYKFSFLFLLIYSILDNFGFSGGRNGYLNIQSIGKQDAPIAIIFLIISLLIVSAIYKKKYSEFDTFLFLILSLFIYQLKVSGVAIIFIVIIYFYFYFRDSDLKIRWGFRSSIIPSILFFLWSIKSLLQTGCFVFPSTFTCFSFEWVDKDYIKGIEDVTVGFSQSYNFKGSLIVWFQQYLSNPTNKIILSNFLISFFIILGIKLFFTKFLFHKKIGFIFIIYFSLSILFFLRFGPDARYLVGLQMLIISSLGIFSIEKIRIPQFIFFALFFISIISLPRLDSYNSFSLSNLPSIQMPKAELVTRYDRYYPKEGDQCWVNLSCSSNREDYFIVDKFFFKTVYFRN